MADDEVSDAVDGALKVQGYRKVATDALTEAGEIDLTQGGIPDELATLLLNVTRDPQWRLVAEQLALLRTRGGPVFRHVYLAVKKRHLCLAVVCDYDEHLRLPRYTADFDLCWDVLRFLEEYVGRYRLSPDAAAAAHRAVDTYGQAGGATVAAGLSVLASAIELSETSRGPCGSFFAVARAGADHILVQRLKGVNLTRTKGAWANVPCQAGYLWNPRAATVHGRAATYTVDRASLERQLGRFLPPTSTALRPMIDGTATRPPVPLAPKPPAPKPVASKPVASKPAASRPVASKPPAPQRPAATERPEPGAVAQPPAEPPARTPGAMQRRLSADPRQRYSVDDVARLAREVAEEEAAARAAKNGTPVFLRGREERIRREARQALAHSAELLRQLETLFASRDAMLRAGKNPPERTTSAELINDIQPLSPGNPPRRR